MVYTKRNTTLKHLIIIKEHLSRSKLLRVTMSFEFQMYCTFFIYNLAYTTINPPDSNFVSCHLCLILKYKRNDQNKWLLLGNKQVKE